MARTVRITADGIKESDDFLESLLVLVPSDESGVKLTRGDGRLKPEQLRSHACKRRVPDTWAQAKAQEWVPGRAQALVRVCRTLP